jgi:hypothetical protein
MTPWARKKMSEENEATWKEVAWLVKESEENRRMTPP